jgi:biopolymer transport protein ExbB/TolQ
VVVVGWFVFQSATLVLLSSWVLAVLNIVGFGVAAALVWSLAERVGEGQSPGDGG